MRPCIYYRGTFHDPRLAFGFICVGISSIGNIVQYMATYHGLGLTTTPYISQPVHLCMKDLGVLLCLERGQAGKQAERASLSADAKYVG